MKGGNQQNYLLFLLAGSSALGDGSADSFSFQNMLGSRQQLSLGMTSKRRVGSLSSSCLVVLPGHQLRSLGTGTPQSLVYA